MTMSIAQRIIIARKLKNISQSKLAEFMKVSRGSCSQWERAITTPSVEHLSKLALLLDVNFEWLATGRGERDYKDLNSVKEHAGTYLDSNQVVSLFQLLPNDLQSCIHDMLKIQSDLLSKDPK